MKAGLLYDQLGAEEYGILLAADRVGVQVEALNAKTLLFSSEFRAKHDVYIGRCKSVNRRMKLAELLENFGLSVINSHIVEKNCNDKSLTTILFNRGGIPAPDTCFIPYNSIQDEKGRPFFRREELKEVVEKIESSLTYPMVVKPVLGSWGKQIRKIEDEKTLRRELMNNFPNMMNHVGFYVQEFIPKAFDVRAYVVVLDGDSRYITALARVSPSDDKYVTNTAQGGMPVGLDVPNVLKRFLLRISETVASDQKAALLAIDVMPVMEDEEERHRIYELHRQLFRHFRKILSVQDRFFRGLSLTRERVEAADRWLRGVFEDFKHHQIYGELKAAIEEQLREKPILSQEVNSNTDYWFGTRNVTGIDMGDYYVSCAVALRGG